jgi:hypothetical protein
MAAIDISSTGGGTLDTGILQLENGVALDSTLRTVTDQNNTLSTLNLSTDSAQFTSPLRITTDDPSDMYLDCEDGSANNRFNITRNTASQQVNLNFASNPAGSTTTVGAIRTFTDGVNLGEVVKFREDGQVTFTERVNVEADSLVTTQGSSVIAATTTNANLVIAPNGTGALVASIPDGTATGGNARGNKAIDFQINRSNFSQVASGEESMILGGNNNRASGYHSLAAGGQNNASGYTSIAIGENCTATASYAISLGNNNTVSSNNSTVSGGQSNTASTNTHATVVGGHTNTSSGQYAVSGGNANTASGNTSIALGDRATASGFAAVAIGNATSSSTRSVAIGSGTLVSGGDGSIGFMGGQVTDLGGTESVGACAFGRSKTKSIGGFAFGEDSLSYLRNQFVQSPINIYGGNTTYLGHSQASQVIALRQAILTTGATTVLSLDGTGTTNLIIPDGNNRVWNVVASWTAVVTAITGTATGVSVGDVATECNLFAFKKIAGVSSIVGTVTSVASHNDASMATAAMGYTAGASQELTPTFSAPIFVGGGSLTIRVVLKLMLTEVAY